jgi:hypothetical protein
VDQSAVIVGGLLAAFWAGTTAVLAGVKYTNKVRDRIVLGKIETHVLPEEYARQLLWLDWLPMKASLAFVSLTLGVIVVLLPELTGSQSTPLIFRLACYLASVVPFAGSVTFVVSGVIEWRFMKSVLVSRTTNRRQTNNGDPDGATDRPRE